MKVDLEQFVATRVFGEIDRTSTLDEVYEKLGEPDPGGYPGTLPYGHVVFEFSGGTLALGVQIAFPHEAHMKPAHPSWTSWKPPTCFDEWPNQRIEWQLGRFMAGASLDTLLPTLPDFIQVDEMNGSTPKKSCTYFDRSGYLQMTFEREGPLFTLSHMVAFQLGNAATI